MSRGRVIEMGRRGRVWVLIGAFFAFSLAGGCGGTDTDLPKGPTGGQPGTVPVHWISVTYQVLYCDASTCPAAGGFTVQSDGRYALTPAAAPSGSLTADERAAADAAASAVAAQDLSGSSACTSFAPRADQPEYELTLRLSNGISQVVESVHMTPQAGLSCVRGDEQKATQLRQELASLADKYDPGSPPSDVGLVLA